jgi:dTDP-4-dehydrorhamnose reductase
MRVLVLGAAGMFGHVLFEMAQREPALDTYATVRRFLPGRLAFPNVGSKRVFECDLTATGRIDPELYCRPEVVVNCAGIIKQVSDAADPIASIKVNALAPHILAECCDRLGARLIQLSTDCVCSGFKGNCSEEDPPDPVDLYGHTKLLGEVKRPPHLTIRTSMIGYEPFRDRSYGLLGWFLAQSGEVRGFTGARWSGVTTVELARLILQLIRRPEVDALLHICGVTINKYELLCLAQSVFGKTDVVVRPDSEFQCDRSMRSTRLAGLGFQIPRIGEMLIDLRDYYARQSS